MSQSTDNPQLPGPIAGWVSRLSEEEMPIFAQTVAEVNRILGKEEYSSLALGRVILQDPSMTAKVLKLANSVFYNPGGTPINTVSRAVVVLGFNAVQAICISIAVIESLLRGPVKQRVQRELARSIHAASQARNLAHSMKDSAGEEVFIAALLMNLGQMAFWCFSGAEGEVLDAALSDAKDTDPAEVEKRVLGFKLIHLTAALAKEWKLTPLVDEALKGKATKDPKARCIDIGHQIARESENGWTTPEMKKVATEAAKILNMNVNEVGVLFQSVAETAVTTAKAMGASVAAKMIPMFRKGESSPESVWDAPPEEWTQPDPMLQLRILREITSMMMTKPDINVVLEMVLEGIHRGVGMDRTVLAMVAPRRTLVKAKFVLGKERIKFTERFQFELGTRPQNLFSSLMDKPRSVWLADYNDPEFDGLIFGSIFETISRTTFFAEPVIFAGQTIGIFYADRFPSKRELDIDSFEGFKLFVHQANLGLDHVARQRMAMMR